jgi:hypothetical protein
MTTDGIIGGYLTADRTHPHVAARVNHLIQWVEHGRYLSILAGQYGSRRRRAPPPLLPVAAHTSTIGRPEKEGV